jgi:hypothetical protein
VYPNANQEQIFAQNFGQARFLYNFFLAERKAIYEAHKCKIISTSNPGKIKTYAENS